MYKGFRKIVFVLISALAIVSCRQAKYVGDGDYLHKKNKIYFETTDEEGNAVLAEEYEGLSEGEMLGLVKPVPNKWFKLFVYNRIDTTRYQNQLDRKHTKVQKKNQKKLDKENEINDRRIDKAKEKGKDEYRHKTKKLKEPKNGWRDWVLKRSGQAPVLYDSSAVAKSNRQLEIYLTKRGYFDATVEDTVIFNEKRQKSYTEYYVNPGQPYVIDSFALDNTADANMQSMYRRFKKAGKSLIVVGMPIDEDILNLERENFSKYCRDEAAYFGFAKNYITYEIDTLGRGHGAVVYMHFIPKTVPHHAIPDSLVVIPHQTYYVSSVTFLLHNSDTMSFKKGYFNFTKRCDALGLPYMAEGTYILLDTLVNIDTLYKRNGEIDSIFNKGVYVYNDVPFLEPDLIDKQNFLYIPHYAKEYYLERTYRTMLQLDVFSTITPEIVVDPNRPYDKYVNVTYHLYPSKRQNLVVEPMVTNSNSILGLMGEISYSNKNLFRGAQKLKVSFVGGFESQPLIIADSSSQSRGGLNTFEWGPSIQISFPKWVPFPRAAYEKSSKRAFPETKIDLTVNIQRREEFRRRLAHFSYEWNFKIPGESGKVSQLSMQFVNFNFVRMIKEPEFLERLKLLNDPFILNSYADHFALFNGLVFKTDNQVPNTWNPIVSIFQVSVLQSGGILNLTGIGSNSLDTNGLKQVFGVPFTQFVRVDNQHLFVYKFANRKHSIANRILAGVGYAYGNSPSMPYEQSFFAGGSNDMRAFEARTMAPGSTRVYEDSTATLTQIGDMRLEWNIEYRFKINKMLEGAFFVDMGNIWKVKDDPTTTKDDLGVFSFSTFYNQVAIGTGFGLRADLEFLIVRLDMSFPIHNPYMPAGEKWIGTPRPTYIATWDQGANGNNNGIIDPVSTYTDANGNLVITSGDTNGNGVIDSYDEANQYYAHPFKLRFNFGIGYPF